MLRLLLSGRPSPSSGQQRLGDICRRYRLGLVYLFGSESLGGLAVLTGDEGSGARPSDPLADLDLGVVTLDDLPEAAERANLYSTLYGELEDLFAPFPLDLVLLEENHSVFQFEAVKGICVYQLSERFRDDYEMDILRRAADFGPVLRMFHRELLEEV